MGLGEGGGGEGTSAGRSGGGGGGGEEQNAGGEEIERGRKRAHFRSANATAGTADFGRRTATAAGQMSSSLLILPSNL